MTQRLLREGAVRVVLVEGNDDLRDLWGTALMLADFAVRSFAHPADALAEVMRAPPQIVVASIVLPDMTGDAFARAVRAARLPRCPALVALTSFSGTLRKEEAGLFDRVLVKPVLGERLVAELRGLVEGLTST